MPMLFIWYSRNWAGEAIRGHILLPAQLMELRHDHGYFPPHSGQM